MSDIKTAPPQVTQTTAGTVKSAGQLLGTNTNDAAASGYVGEYILAHLSQASARSLSTGVTNNFLGASITLSAGDWLLGGSIGFVVGATTVWTDWEVGWSSTTSTLPPSSNIGFSDGAGNMAYAGKNSWGSNTNVSIAMPTINIQVSNGNTLTVYPVVSVDFTTSTLTAYGEAWARRVR